MGLGKWKVGVASALWDAAVIASFRDPPCPDMGSVSVSVSVSVVARGGEGASGMGWGGCSTLRCKGQLPHQELSGQSVGSAVAQKPCFREP